jgi:hypothetical protein
MYAVKHAGNVFIWFYFVLHQFYVIEFKVVFAFLVSGLIIDLPKIKAENFICLLVELSPNKNVS